MVELFQLPESFGTFTLACILDDVERSSLHQHDQHEVELRRQSLVCIVQRPVEHWHPALLQPLEQVKVPVRDARHVGLEDKGPVSVLVRVAFELLWLP